jgi:drug/metabolite transporter (DMT)-like permease
VKVPAAVAAVLALIGFAANSLLCRAAIGAGAIDPGTFTIVRMTSGLAALFLLSRSRARNPEASAAPAGRSFASYVSGFALALYAVAFAFAYVKLSAGTGALLLFGSVQLTMMAAALFGGERPRAMEWVGYALALGGLLWLVMPGVKAPPAFAAALMVFAGVAWGVYTLRGRGATDPLAQTTVNFERAMPFVFVAFMVLSPERRHVSWNGIALAIASGALASGVGYALWYRALPSLTRARAATLQLAVPVLAALGGVTLLGESVSTRLVGSAVLVLGGIGLAVRARR